MVKEKTCNFFKHLELLKGKQQNLIPKRNEM